MGIRIDALDTGLATRDHELPAMDAGVTSKLSVADILDLILRADLPADVESALALAESALQAVPDNAVTTTKILDANVTNAKLADMAQATVIGRASGAGTGVPSALPAADIFAILGGLVPAKPQLAAGAGQRLFVEVGAGLGYTLPAGGTWAWWFQRFSSTTGAISGGANAGSVDPGGTVVRTAVGGTFLVGEVWRIS